MKLILLLTFIFSALITRADGICIRLESISIGCVPSTDHPCFKNKNLEVDGFDAAKCKYFPEGAFLPPGPAQPNSDAYFDKTVAATAGPIAWTCQTWENSGPCPPGGDVSTCPHSKCLVYQQPVCRNQCTWCIKDYKEDQNSAAGCIVCTRPYCEPPKPDPEPKATAYCPLHPMKLDGSGFDMDYSLPKQGFPKCPGIAPDPCPSYATPPTQGATCDGPMQGDQCKVDTGPEVTACPPRPQVQKVEQVVKPAHCPWIIDERTYIPASKGPPPVAADNKCEVISIGNRFPGDCCKCRDAANQILENGKSCNNGCGPLPASVICN